MIEAVAGALSGVVGSLVSRVMGIFEAREQRKTLKLEHELQVELQVERTLSASYLHDSSLGGLLRWVRPVLTLLLIALSAMVYFTISDCATRPELADRIVYLTSTAVGWWFADRSGRR